MNLPTRLILMLALAIPLPHVVSASELLVGFTADVPLAIGNPTTLATTPGPGFGAVLAACSSTDAFYLATAGWVHRIDPVGGMALESFHPPHPVKAMAIGSDGLALASPDGTVSICDPLSGAVIRFSSLAKPLLGVAAAGGRLYVETGDQQLWSAAERDLVWAIELAMLPEGSGAMVVRGSSLLIGTPGHVAVVERDSGELIYGYNVPNDAAAMSLHGNDVLVAGSDGSLVRIDPDSGDIGAIVTFGNTTAPQAVSALAVHAADPFALLKTSTSAISISEPAAVQLRLEVDDSLGSLAYLMLGSVSGTFPGAHVSGIHLPLNPDAYTLLTLLGTPLLLGGFGAFSDANALKLFMADAAFTLPVGVPPGLAGITIHHAFVVFDPLSAVALATSNAAPLVLLP